MESEYQLHKNIIR